MGKFLLISSCLLAVVVMGVQSRKLPPSPLALKYQNLNYFENDPEFQLTEDKTDDATPVNFQGDNMKAKIVSQASIQQKGKFKYSLDTENGISVQQAGKLKDGKTFVVQGSYSYTGADGRRYRVKYTADELGYHPITELEVDLPDLDANQNDIPDVAPFKPAFEPIRVQKQTPAPVFQVVTAAPPVYSAPLVSDLYNPYGNPGPFVGDRYLPPNDYLPPSSDTSVPAGAFASSQTNYLAAPAAEQYDSSSSVFKYV